MKTFIHLQNLEPIEETVEIVKAPAINDVETEQELERVRQREEAIVTDLRVFEIYWKSSYFNPIDVDNVPDYYDKDGICLSIDDVGAKDVFVVSISSEAIWAVYDRIR